MIDSEIERIEGIVKWYNTKKGYGFVFKEEGFPDIFLHFSALDSVGLQSICDGDIVVCDIVKNWNGYQVSKIYEVRFDHSLSDKGMVNNSNIIQTTGEVKWYNTMKGFGFIFDDEDRSEIFFHSSILHPAMYQDLIPTRRVSVLFFETEKGKEAKEIKFL